jgi:hypothetical protein
MIGSLAEELRIPDRRELMEVILRNAFKLMSASRSRGWLACSF